MAFNNFPYTDYHDINLDWVIKTIKDLGIQMDEFTAANQLTFVGEWVIGQAYKAWSAVVSAGNTYVAVKPVPAGIPVTDTEYWVLTANYNAQLEEYKRETDAAIAGVQRSVEDLAGQVEAVYPSQLIVNRTGTELIRDSETAFSGLQGVDRITDGIAVAYFADYRDQSGEGVIRVLDTTTNGTLAELQIPAQHGQNVVYDGSGRIYILNWDSRVPELVSVVDRAEGNVLTYVGTVPVEFPEDVTGRLVSLYWDNGLRGVINRDNILNVCSLTYTGTSVVIGTVGVRLSGAVSFCAIRRWGDKYVTLNNVGGNSLSIYGSDGSLLRSITIPLVTSDRFYVGEMEAFYLTDSGDLTIFANIINNRGLYISTGSGWYMYHILTANLYNRYPPKDGAIGVNWESDFRRKIYVDPGRADFTGTGVSAADPVASIHIALLYQPHGEGYDIIMSGAENVDNLGLVGRDDIIIDGNNNLTVEGAARMYGVSNVVMSGAEIPDVYVNRSDMVLTNIATNSVHMVSSRVTANGGTWGAVDSDAASTLDNIAVATDYSAYTNKVPKNATIYYTAALSYSGSGNLPTGFRTDKLPSANTVLEVQFVVNGKYLAGQINAVLGWQEIVTSDGANVYAIKLRITGGELYVNAIYTLHGAALTLSQFTQVNIYR